MDKIIKDLEQKHEYYKTLFIHAIAVHSAVCRGEFKDSIKETFDELRKLEDMYEKALQALRLIQQKEKEESNEN